MNSLLPTGKQVFSQAQESRAPSWDLEDECHNPECPPFLLLPQVYLLNVALHGLEHPLGQLVPAVLSTSPPNTLCTPSGAVKEQKRPRGCESPAQQSRNHWCVINTVFITKPKHVTIKKKKLTLSQPKPADFLHPSRGLRHTNRLLPACPDSPRLRGIPKFPQFRRKLCQYLAGKQQSEINRGN